MTTPATTHSTTPQGSGEGSYRACDLTETGIFGPDGYIFPVTRSEIIAALNAAHSSRDGEVRALREALDLLNARTGAMISGLMMDFPSEAMRIGNDWKPLQDLRAARDIARTALEGSPK